MKKLLVTQYGTKSVDTYRSFVVVCPDDVDPDSFNDDLDTLAEEAGIAWEFDDDDYMIFADRVDTEDDPAWQAELEEQAVIYLHADEPATGMSKE